MPSGPEPAAARLLAEPFQDREALVAGIATDLAGLAGFDPAANLIPPAESTRYAEASVRVRQAVLVRVYGEEYPADAYATERLARRIRAGEEAIWFWGSGPAITGLRSELTDPSRTVPELPLGTVTVITVEDEYGPGHGELCRSGSTDRQLGAKGPILARTLAYHRGDETHPHERYHTLVLTSRARATAPGVRGGEAVQRIHRRYVRSRFWGYLPYYVMPGGVLEQMELRECNRDPSDVARALGSGRQWWFADEADARFASALAEVNMGWSPPVAVRNPPPGAEPPHRYRLLCPDATDLASVNHITARPVDTGQPGLTLPEAAAGGLATGACCCAVQVALDEPDAPVAQRWLSGAGFTLGAVCPPKDSWFVYDGERRRVQCAPYGIWIRPRDDLAVAPPFYQDWSATDAAEATILDHLRSRLSRHRRVAR